MFNDSKNFSITKIVIIFTEDPNSQVKGKFEEYRKTLNCTVEYNYESNIAEDMEGTLRLKVEPTGEKFTIQNILLNGTYLHRVDWVFGLVLKCGKESNIYENTDFKIKKKNFFDRIIYKFSIFLIIGVILLSLLSKLLYAERQSTNKSLSEIESYLSQNNWHGDKSIMIDSRTFYIIFSVCLPMSIFALLDTLIIYQKILLQNKEKQIVRVNNPDILPNLGVVNWAFFDKTGTITNNRLKIESIILENELYFLDKNSQFYRQMLDLENQEEMLIEEQELQIAGLGIQAAAPSQIIMNTAQQIKNQLMEEDESIKKGIGSGNILNEAQRSQPHIQSYSRTQSDGNKNSLPIQSNPFLAKIAIQHNMLQNSMMMISGSPHGNIDSSIFGVKSGMDAGKLKLQRNGTSSFRLNTMGEVASPFVKNNSSNSQEQRKRMESVFVKAPSRFATVTNNLVTNIPSIQTIVNNEVTSLNDLNKPDNDPSSKNIPPIIETSLQQQDQEDSESIKQNRENRISFSPNFNLMIDQNQKRNNSFLLEKQQDQKVSIQKDSDENIEQAQSNRSIDKKSDGADNLSNRGLKKSNNLQNKNNNEEDGMICNFLGNQNEGEDDEDNNPYRSNYLTHQNNNSRNDNYCMSSNEKIKLTKKHNTIIQEVEERNEDGEDGQDDQDERANYGLNRDVSPKNSILIQNKQKSNSSANINNSNQIQSPKFKTSTQNTQSFNNLQEINGTQIKSEYNQNDGTTGVFGQDSIQEQDEDEVIQDITINISDEENNLEFPSEQKEINTVMQWNYGNAQVEFQNFTLLDIPASKIVHNQPHSIVQPQPLQINKSPLRSQSLQNLDSLSPLPGLPGKKVTSNTFSNQQETYLHFQNPSENQIEEEAEELKNKEIQQGRQNPQSLTRNPSLKVESKDMISSQVSNKGMQTFKKRLLSRGASLDVNINIGGRKGVRFAGNEENNGGSPLAQNNSLKQIHEVSKQFQFLSHSKSTNQHDMVVRTRPVPGSINTKKEQNVMQEIGDLSPVSFKRATHLQRLTRLNIQALNSFNVPPNNIINTTASNIKQSQISEVSIQKITYHEGEAEFLNRMTEYKESTQDFIKSLIVCQGWKIKIQKDRLVQMEGKKREDEYIYKYIKSLGIKCELRKNRNQYYIISNIKNKKAPNNKVVIRKSIDFYNNRNRTSFLVEESQLPSEKDKITSKSNQLNTPVTYALYVKGDASTLDNCKEMNEMFKERLRFCINKQFELGCRAIIYGKKQLTKKQTEEIESIIKTMKTNVEEYEGYYEKLLQEIESEIQFLGIIFIQDQINEGFMENLQFLNDTLIKVGILSGDTQEKVKSVANLTQFTTPQYGLPQKIFEIEGFNSEEISISIKKSLASLKDLFSSESTHENKNLMLENHEPDFHDIHENNENQIEKKLEQNQSIQTFSFTQDRKVFQNVLIVGQKQLDIISTNQSLEAHFAFILAHVGKVIAYELRAEHKQYFVRLVKFIDAKNVVMSIGDGWNDALMMQISDVSFEFRSEESTTQKAENAISQEMRHLATQKSSNSPQNNKQKTKPNKASTFGGTIQNTLLYIPTKTIQLLEEDKKKVISTFSYPNAGDIIIQDLSLIKFFMKFYAPRLFKQYQTIIFESFYFSFLLFLFNLSSNWETFSGNLQLSNSDFIFLSIVIFIPRILCYIFFYDPLKYSYQFPLIFQFDKLYHNNKVQRQLLRVSSLFTNSLIEGVFHFVIIYLTSISCNINDSFENLRFFIVLQILIVTRFKMFYEKQIDLKYPKLALICFLTYETFVSYLYFGVFLEYSNTVQRSELGQAFSDGQNIMILFFNLIISGLFTYFYYEFRLLQNDLFLNKFLRQIDTMQRKIKEVFESAFRRMESNMGDHSNKQANSINRINSFHQIFFEKEISDYLQIFAKLEQFLENQIHQIKKPYTLIKKIFKNVKIDKHIEQILNPAELSFSIGQGFSKNSLEFIDEGLQKNYEAQHSKSTLLNLRFNMVLNTLPSLLICILSYSLNEPLRGEESYSESVVSFRLVSLILCIFYMILSFAFFREKFLPVMQGILILFMLVGLFYQIIFGWYKLIDFSAIVPFISYSMSLLPLKFLYTIGLSSFNLGLQYIWFSVHINDYIKANQEQYLKDSQSTLLSIYLFICYFVFCIICWVLSLQNKFIDETDTKNEFLLKIQFQEEKSQRQDILGILLPEFIREDVILGKSNFSRDQEEASILFCDVSDFDKIMDREDYKIVSLLDNLFREFDELTLQYGLQKIETVGKTYMAAGGLKAVEKNLSKKITRTYHFIRMLIMSNKMHQVAARSQWGDGFPIKLKIGIHIGPITAGVIGYHKPQFSLIGDTVNTTSRLCSNCDPGRSLFSDIIFEKISPYLENNTTDIDWAFEEFEFEAKGKGTLKAYYIAEYIENEIQKSQLVVENNHQLTRQVVPNKRTQRDRYKTRIFDLKPHFSENEFDQVVDESQELRSPGEINSGDLRKSNFLNNFKKSITDGDPFNSIDKKKQRKYSANKMLSDEFKSLESPNAEHNNKSINRYPSNNNSYIQPISNNASFLNIPNQSERKGVDQSAQNETSNMLSPTVQKKREKNDKINGILNLKKGKLPSVQNSVILENGVAGEEKKPQSNQTIPLNSAGVKVQISDHKSTNSIIMGDQQNPQEDDRSAFAAASVIRNNNFDMRRQSKVKILDPKGILRRQDSKISTKKEDLMEKSIISDIGKNIQNIDQDESQSTSATDDNEVEILKYNWLLMVNNRDQKHLYKNFESLLQQRHSFVFTFQLIIMLVLNFLMMTFRILILQNGINWIFYSCDIISIAMAFIPVLSWEKLWKSYQLRYVTIIIFVLSTVSVMGEFYFSHNGIFKVFDMLHIQALAIFAIINKCVRFTDAILYSTALIIAFQTIDIFKGAYCMSDIIILAVPIIGFLFQKRQSMKRSLEFFNKNRSNDHQKHQEVRLLVHLLPSHIFDTFLRNPEDNSIFTEKFTNCTLLFADISGFTAYSSNKKPDQVVHMLKSLFTKFDHKCIKHNVFKLYTIGDCYIVMGFSDANKRDPPTEAKNVLEMGFSMIESLRQFRLEQKDPSDQNADIHMRIGIHIGDIIGGVIGKNVVRYDIYGKDVLLANKMESNGERGRILISDPLKQVLQEHFPDKYEYKQGPEVQVKSINIKMKSHFVDQSQKQD